MKILHVALAACLAGGIAGPVLAEQEAPETSYTKTVEAEFDDVAFAVEQAITGEGLVIDLTSHVGDMLARTKQDVGGAKDLFAHASVFSFCSASISRQAMEADLANLQFCPYGIFVYETVEAPGQIVVGHRINPGSSMAGVNEMLTRIVDSALE
ncbi:DUF302 domain-containing protein [Paracoccus thiocyanatus]|uniref:DUF302 domain-containing protein n=1 Tax=Paracoccus thiocyanatus TaxID=34006 RepID=A0A3D8PCM0_9RHOB|nr:DUF302 domain-containing protein [Paracoccus thiocyanatus]RDW12909.1 DUF302 domain-containing protein [Paracoccus thiocyanatus]